MRRRWDNSSENNLSTKVLLNESIETLRKSASAGGAFVAVAIPVSRKLNSRGVHALRSLPLAPLRAYTLSAYIEISARQGPRSARRTIGGAHTP